MNKFNHSKIFLVIILSILFAGNSYSVTLDNQNTRQFTVVIDPGHGGKDPGAVNKSIREKEIVLGIGLKLGKLINENFSDVKVIFTRNTDVFIPLIERSRIANKNKADLFISLHANACGTPSTRGTETFFLGPSLSDENLEVAKKENSVILLEEDYSTTYEGFDPNSSESYIMFEMAQSVYMDQSLYFADAIQQQFNSRIESPNRGVRQAGFLVLKKSTMPSVLVETGFLSNTAEANFLKSENGQQHIALSVFEAFRKFKNKNSGTVNTKTTEVLANPHKAQDTTTKQEERSENLKVEVRIQETKVDPTMNSEKIEIMSAENQTIKVDNTYYSVQIGANKTPLEPSAANFKGLKNIRREKNDQYYRYYVGKESAIDNITSILNQIKPKFPQAFIVSFVEGRRVPLNVGSN